MTSPHEHEGNPPTAKKAVYYIIIETTQPVSDTEWQMDEVSDRVEQMTESLNFDANVWIDEVEYET